MALPRVAIIIGTTREGRFADQPACWIYDIASRRADLAFEMIDLRDYSIGLFDEPVSPAYKPARNPVAVQWNAVIAGFDGYIFITAEYNRSISGALKNALDHAYPAFNRKAAAFVGYGGVGGARAIEQLRLICVELQLAPTRTGVHIGLEAFRAVRSGTNKLPDFDFLNQTASQMLEELAWWTLVLKAGRDKGQFSWPAK